MARCDRLVIDGDGRIWKEWIVQVCPVQCVICGAFVDRGEKAIRPLSKGLGDGGDVRCAECGPEECRANR